VSKRPRWKIEGPVGRDAAIAYIQYAMRGLNYGTRIGPFRAEVRLYDSERPIFDYEFIRSGEF
jgi:hypothetical protein